MVIINFISY